MSDENVTALAHRPTKPVDVVRTALERMKPQLALALPKHLTADRLLRVAMTAVQNTPKLLDCDRTSLYSAIMACAQLGLEPDGVLGQAYLVPFGGKVQFLPGYRGLITLARNSGDVSSISAHEVRENDIFEFDFASGDPPRHTFDLRQSRGEIIAFYAIAKFKDGSFYWDMMTDAEVKAIRDKSQGYRTAKKYNKEADSPWGAYYVEMGRKTLIRRISKYLPMSVQKAAALADSYDTGKHVTIDNHGELVIEGEAHEQEDAPAIEHKATHLDRFEEQHGDEMPDRGVSEAQMDRLTDEEPPGYEPEPQPDPRPVDTGGHERWIDNFNALAPRADLTGGTDWRTYAEGVGYLLSQAGRDDLAALEVSKHPHLMRMRAEDNDTYRSITGAIAARAKELAGGGKAAA